MASELERSARRFRTALLRRDEAARAAIRRSFEVAIAGLQTDLKATMERIAQIEAGGEKAPLWRLLAEQRTRQLLARAQLEMGRFADAVEAETVRSHQFAVQKAQEDAQRLIAEAFGAPPAGAILPIHTVNTGALVHLTGSLQPGSPVRALLDEFSGKASQAVQEELIAGVARGAGFSEIARAIVARMKSDQLARAELIVRTELMRSYREASLETYKANAHLMRGWRWYSALDSRTCPVCLSMHGRLFPLDVDFASHPNCRCVAIPETKSWKELGYDVPDTRPAIRTGPEVFADWPAAQQRGVLGPGAYAAYKAGEVELGDFVGITQSDVWGTGRRRVSLERARQKGRQAA